MLPSRRVGLELVTWPNSGHDASVMLHPVAPACPVVRAGMLQGGGEVHIADRGDTTRHCLLSGDIAGGAEISERIPI